MELFTPKSYLLAPPQEKRRVCNGCGTGGWKGKLVPETLWWLNVTKSCNIHDWMYYEGKTIEDKRKADRVFMNNMLREIEHKGGNWLIQKLRRRRARTYFIAVDEFGGPAFWEGKN